MNILSNLCVLFAAISGCMQQKVDCLQEMHNKWKTSDEYKDINRTFHDTLNKWMADGVFYTQQYKIKKYKVDDVLFFSSDMKIALLLLLWQDIESDAHNDGIQMLLCRKVDVGWRFYMASMPTMYVGRRHKADPTIPYSFDELSDLVRKQILQGGYFKFGCKINDEYMHGWYDEWMEWHHDRFLKQRHR